MTRDIFDGINFETEGDCYCCGRPGKMRRIWQGLSVYLCSECDGAKIDRQGFVCPKHGRPTPVEIINEHAPLSYPVVCEGGTRFFDFVKYDERLPKTR